VHRSSAVEFGFGLQVLGDATDMCYYQCASLFFHSSDSDPAPKISLELHERQPPNPKP
jgi:hypothetical protein